MLREKSQRETEAGQQKNPQTASVESEYHSFAHPQADNLQLFFSYHLQLPTELPRLAKVFHSIQGNNIMPNSNLFIVLSVLAFTPTTTDNPFIKGVLMLMLLHVG